MIKLLFLLTLILLYGLFDTYAEDAPIRPNDHAAPKSSSQTPVIDISANGEASVRIDSAAKDALNADPFSSVADEISLLPVDCDAREIKFRDERGVLSDTFGDHAAYLVDAETVTLDAKLTKDIDPEDAFFCLIPQNSFFSLRECAAEDGYQITQSFASASDGGFSYTGFILGLNSTGSKIKTVLLFQNEESIEAFINDFALAGWEFFETENAKMPGFSFMSEAVYTVSCVDQNGVPVPGVMLQICDETSCRVAPTDANGIHTFTSAPCAWEVHVLIAPNGYTASDESCIFPKAGGELTLTLRKN